MTCYLITFIISLFISLVIFYNTTTLLTLIGAKGFELQAASDYLKITIIVFPITALGMQITLTLTLRALGQAKLGLYRTLVGGLINMLIDPILIFHFKLDIKGAAFASLMAKGAMLILAIYYLLIRVKFVKIIAQLDIKQNAKHIFKVAIPVSLTQIATQINHLYITYEMAKLGAGFITGWAIISRLIPFAFMMLFAMPGTIGPIISQNLGAKRFKRVRSTLNQALNFIIKYVFVLALSLSLLQEHLISLFNTQADTATLIRFFCQYIAISFIFVVMNLVAMSFLNNAGYPKIATQLNLSKMFLGTIPFVCLGSYYYGAQGILVGQAIGSVVFGLIAICFCYRILNKSKSN